MGPEQVEDHDTDDDDENDEDDAVVVPRFPVPGESLLAGPDIAMRGQGPVRPPAKGDSGDQEDQDKSIVGWLHRSSLPPSMRCGCRLASVLFQTIAQRRLPIKAEPPLLARALTGDSPAIA
jgi:hypothetical protein